MSNFVTALKCYALLIAVLTSSVLALVPRKPQRYYSGAEIENYTAAAREAGANGMIIAMGGGFDTDETFGILIKKAMEHVGKDAPNMLFIPSGHRDVLEEPETIPARFAAAGCATDTVLISVEDADSIAAKIEWADIIYETGGSLEFLTDTWGGKGVFEMMRKAFSDGKVLMGVSTGAMCWAARGWDDTGDDVLRVIGSFPFVGHASSFHYYEASDIIPFCLVPHFDSFGWRAFTAEAKKLDIPSVGIENGAALVFTGGEYSVITDPVTPLRTAYLFIPEKGISFCDLRRSSAIAAVADGEQRLAR